MSTAVQTTAVHKTINSAFEEFVEEPTKLTEALLSLAKENSFNTKKVNEEFRKFLKKVGADGDDLNDMAKTGREMLTAQIIPNQASLWPEQSGKQKLKLPTSMKKSTSATASASASASADADEVEAEAEAEDEAEDEAEAASTDAKKGKKAPRVKKEKAPTKSRGYDIFFNEHKEGLKKQLMADWAKKFKDQAYVANPTAVSRELGRRWREDLNDAERNTYNETAAARNEENGIVPKTKKQVSESEKKPMTAYQMFAKSSYDRMEQRYREENDLAEDAKVKPTEIMVMTAAEWNAEIKGQAREEEFKTKAEEYNAEHGRVQKPKAAKEKSTDKKTTAYREFCSWFREDYRKRTPEHNPYKEAQEMNRTWNEEIKTDEAKKAHWDEMASSENLSRGFTVEGSATK